MDTTNELQKSASHHDSARPSTENDPVLTGETLNLLFALSQSFQEEVITVESIGSTVTDGVRQLLHADMCLLFLPERSDSLVLRGVSPSEVAPSLPFAALTLEAEVLRRHTQLLRLPSPTIAQLNPPLSHLQSGIAVPFRVLHGRQMPGLLCCYFSDVRWLSDEQQKSLFIVAQHIASLLFRKSILDLLRQRYLLKSFLEQLFQHPEGAEATLRRHGNFLKLDLERPHTVVFAEIRGKGEEQVAQSLRGEVISFFEAKLREDFPASLCYDDDQLLTYLIDAASPTSIALQDELRDLSLQISSAYQVRLFTGLSNPCQRLADYRRASSEAIQALHTGYGLHADGGATHYNDIRIYEYLTIAPQLTHDSIQEQLAMLLRYDQHHKKKDRLLETLEVYLQSQGNMAKAGIRLRVHRNTVEQRLRRIQDVAGLDVLDADTSVFDLELALRVFKLRLHPHSDS